MRPQGTPKNLTVCLSAVCVRSLRSVGLGAVPPSLARDAPMPTPVPRAAAPRPQTPFPLEAAGLQHRHSPAAWLPVPRGSPHPPQHPPGAGRCTSCCRRAPWRAGPPQAAMARRSPRCRARPRPRSQPQPQPRPRLLLSAPPGRCRQQEGAARCPAEGGSRRLPSRRIPSRQQGSLYTAPCRGDSGGPASKPSLRDNPHRHPTRFSPPGSSPPFANTHIGYARGLPKPNVS